MREVYCSLDFYHKYLVIRYACLLFNRPFLKLNLLALEMGRPRHPPARTDPHFWGLTQSMHHLVHNFTAA